MILRLNNFFEIEAKNNEALKPRRLLVCVLYNALLFYLITFARGIFQPLTPFQLPVLHCRTHHQFSYLYSRYSVLIYLRQLH